MAGGWPFIGRQAELSLIDHAMRAERVGGIVVAGPAGVGKTMLAVRAVSRADPRYCVTRRVVATEATRLVPFGALASVLPAELPVAAGRVNLLRAAIEALVAVAGRRRLVLHVDDAHLLDDLSAALLLQLVRSAAAFVLVVVRGGVPAPEPVTALWRDQLVARVDLPELERPAIEELLAEYLGDPLEGAATERLCRASAGNLLLLRELVTAGQQAGALRRVEGVWRWPGPWVLAPRLVDLIERRLDRLSPAEREAAELIAYAEPIEVRALRLLVPAYVLEAVEAKELCWAEEVDRQVIVHLAHPLYGEVLRARTPVLRARRLQRQLAEALERRGTGRPDDVLRVVSWRLASGTPTPPAVLLRAAQRAWALLDLGLTERLARATIEAGAVLPGGQILWRVLMLHGRHEEMGQLLADLRAVATSDREQAGLAIAGAYRQWARGRIHTGLAELEAVLPALAEPRSRAELRATKAAMLAYAGRYRAAVGLATELLAGADHGGSTAAQARYVTGLTHLHRGRLVAAVTSLDAAVSSSGWPADVPWLGVSADTWRCQAELLRGDLAAAAEVAEKGYRAGLAGGWDLTLAFGCAAKGQVCRARGQLREAVRWFREGLGIFREDRYTGYLWTPSLLGELAHTAALLGDQAGARRALAEAEASLRPGTGPHESWITLARPWVTAVAGDLATARGQALHTAATLRGAGGAGYEAVALHDAARLGAPGTAGRLRDLADANPSPLLDCFAVHAATQARHDAAGLEAVARDLADLGATLLAAEAAAEAASAHQRAGRVGPARRAAARAGALAARCDLPATPTLRTLRLPGLTPREWQVANLAAAGHPDTEIANQLAISIRTVHNHLHHTYIKLGLHRRTDLAAALAPITAIGLR